MVVIWPTGKTRDKITEKAVNEMRQVRIHTWAPGTSFKLKSSQDLSIRVNPEVTEEVVHHAGLWLDGGLHLRLHMCKVIHPMLESYDPLHRALSLVNPITNVPLQRSVPVKVPDWGRDSSSEARLRVTVRGVVNTTLMACCVVVACCATRGVVVAYRAASMQAHPWVRGGPVKLWHPSPI
jgi:hypothetical protein